MIGLFLLASAAAGPVVVNEPVKDQPVAAVAPNESYLMVRAAGGLAASIALFREADAAERADYQARRSAALAKARAKYGRQHATWIEDVETWKATSPSMRGPLPEEPVEPNDETLDFPTMEQEQVIALGPFNRFAKDKVNDLSVYLNKVRPGRYHFYGPLTLGANGAAAGTCMCMGSIAFDVAPGQITDAGTMHLNFFDALKAARTSKGPKLKDGLDLPDGMTQVSWTPPTQSTPIDPRLSSYKIVRATLRPTGPFANWYKAQVDRLTAIPGILEYRRDQIIDPQVQGTAAGH